MARINIIKKNEEFQYMFDKGHSIYSRHLVVYFLQNNLGFPRFGFCVGKKIGNAVTRNRIKRLFREVARLEECARLTGWDMLFVARHPVLKATLNDIVNDVKYILGKAQKSYSANKRGDSG